VAIALTAPVAAWAAWYREAEIRRPGSRWRRAFIGWNVLGLLEHAVAVGLGILHFPGYLQVFDGEPSTVAFAELPLMLFPAYMVPFACLLHLVMIDVVRRPPAVVAPTPGARPAVAAPIGT
jgi:hypothetical protein